MNEKMFSEVVEILVQHVDTINKDSIKLNSDLKELGVDSLNNIKIVLSIESKFDVEFSEEDAANIQTVNDLIKLIISKQGALA
jgi:acyl carrier protein